jgi:hypothetical protein
MSELKKTAAPLPEDALVFNGKGVVGENIHFKSTKLIIDRPSDELLEILISEVTPADPFDDSKQASNDASAVDLS